MRSNDSIEWKNKSEKAHILCFPIKHLSADGFVAAEYLRKISADTGKNWYIYGSFRDLGDLRCYLTMPQEMIIKNKKPTELVVFDWKITGADQWPEKIRQMI